MPLPRYRSFAIPVSSVPCIVAASYSAPFSSAHFPCPPLILLPYRCHSPSLRAVIVLASSRSASCSSEGVAWRCHPIVSSARVGNQAGGAMSFMSSVLSSRRCVSWWAFLSCPACRLVRRGVGRSVSRRHAGDNGASRQAGGRVLVGYARSSRLCPFYEHQFDIWIPQGSHHPLGSPCLSPVK